MKLHLRFASRPSTTVAGVDCLTVELPSGEELLLFASDDGGVVVRLDQLHGALGRNLVVYACGSNSVRLKGEGR